MSGITDIWLTPKQWDVVRDALIQRGRKVDLDLADRMWRDLLKSPGYQRHLAARNDGEADA